MASYRVYQVDAFTREPFTGNAAGVVTNADGLSDEQMQVPGTDRLHRTLQGEGGLAAPVKVKVAGQATIVFRTEISM